MTWTALRVTSAEKREAVIEALFAAGAQGVQEDGTAVVTHFPPDTNLDDVVRAVRAIDPGADISVSESPDIDWSVAWRDQLGAIDAGRLTVVPPWLAEGRDPSRTVVIDPGMAFGTGDHASTRGVLRLLSDLVAPGSVVADLGAGSAVLAIAAAKLGASRVFAVEVDADAISNAQENIERNQVEEIVHVFEGDAAVLLPLLAPVDLILANIISSILVELLPAMMRALPRGGVAILAGILLSEEESMREVIEADGARVIADDREGDWWSVAIQKP